MEFVQTQITDTNGVLIGSGCVPEGFWVWGNRIDEFQSNDRPFKLGLNAEQREGGVGAVLTADSGEFFTDVRLQPQLMSLPSDGRPQRTFVSAEAYVDECASTLLADHPWQFLSQEYLEGMPADVERDERQELDRACQSMRSSGGVVLPHAVLKRAPVRYYEYSGEDGTTWLLAFGAIMRGTEVVMYAKPTNEPAFPGERVFGKAPLKGATASTIHWQSHMRFCCTFPLSRWSMDEAREVTRVWGQHIQFSSALMQEMQAWSKELNALANERFKVQMERMRNAQEAAMKAHAHHTGHTHAAHHHSKGAGLTC